LRAKECVRLIRARPATRREQYDYEENVARLKAESNRADALAAEYHFDYRKAKANRFAGMTQPESVAVLLDPDVARFFESGESVNTLLRALMTAWPARPGPTAP
jgi:DNA-binding ferritin-like protein (Dps family)